MRSLILLFVLYSALQALTAVDATIRSTWIFYVALGSAAMTGRWTVRAAFEIAIWVRIFAGVALYMSFGWAIDVLAPTLACLFLAYGLWIVQGRRRLGFLVPLALPAAAVLAIKLVVFPGACPQVVIDAGIRGKVRLPQAQLPAGWTRYHCPGYSIGVPPGMMSGYLGGERGNAFNYPHGRPAGETLDQIACVFPRPTAFEYDPEVRPMAEQLLGVTRELDFARYILDCREGLLFLSEKLSWLGMRPPESVDEIELEDAAGFLLAETRGNWYRVRLYAEYGGRDHQIDLWLYGRREELPRERVLAQLATFRVEPFGRNVPRLDRVLELTSLGRDHEANILINSILSLDGSDHEALYVQSLNQHRLGRTAKAREAIGRLRWLASAGYISPHLVNLWRASYASMEPDRGVSHDSLWRSGDAGD